MNLTSPSQVKAWCIENGFHPNKVLGQNFLIDRNALLGIVDAGLKDIADLNAAKVLEVGPGLGVLTEEMLKRGFMAGMTAYAMYAHTFDEVDAYIEAVDEVWGEIAKGGVAARLEGKPAVSGFARIN